MIQYTETKKNSDHLWKENIQQTKSVLPNFSKVAQFKELAQQIYSPVNLILEKRKKFLPLSIPVGPQAESLLEYMISQF